MLSMPDTRSEVRRFLDAYCAAFELRDAAAIADFYAYPSHVTSDTGTATLVSITSRDKWTKKLEEVLATYQKLGFREMKVRDLSVTELSSVLSQACVRYGLVDDDGQTLFEFDVNYTLGRFAEEFRIVQAVSPNENARCRAALEARKVAPLGPWEDHEAPANDQATDGHAEPEYDLFRQRYPHALSALVRFLESEGPSDEQAARFLEQFMAAHEGSAILDAAVALGQECLPHCYSIQALDVLGPKAWASPTALRYLAGQLRFYARANITEQRWALQVSVQLHDAIQRSLVNAKRHGLGKSRTLFEETYDFSWKAAKRPRLECARILLWSEEELLHPMAKVVIDIHSTFHVPLFFLNTERTARALDFICFHCAVGNGQGQESRQSIGCVNSWDPEKRKFVLSRFDDGIVRSSTAQSARGVPAQKLFEEYLAKGDLMFAVDAKEAIERRSRPLRLV